MHMQSQRSRWQPPQRELNWGWQVVQMFSYFSPLFRAEPQSEQLQLLVDAAGAAFVA
jgi:hypothetical protein